MERREREGRKEGSVRRERDRGKETREGGRKQREGEREREKVKSAHPRCRCSSRLARHCILRENLGCSDTLGGAEGQGRGREEEAEVRLARSAHTRGGNKRSEKGREERE